MALFLWKFPDLLDEFTSLREAADRLHERRDRSTADLAQISRRITELEQQLIQLKRAAQSRVYPQTTQRSPVELSHRFDPHESGTPAGQPAAPSTADPALGPWSGPAATAPAPDTLPAAVVSDRVAAGPGSGVASAAIPEAALDLTSDDLVAAGGAALSLAQPPERPASPSPPTLDALIAAMNGESGGPIEGVTCVELDICPPLSEGAESAPAPRTRLRLVNGGGRFLLVLLDGDPWLFPSLDTLANFRTEQPDQGIFHYLPDSCASPRLIRPAMLRDVGGLWEVSDPGQILVPTA